MKELELKVSQQSEGSVLETREQRRDQVKNVE